MGFLWGRSQSPPSSLATAGCARHARGAPTASGNRNPHRSGANRSRPPLCLYRKKVLDLAPGNTGGATCRLWRMRWPVTRTPDPGRPMFPLYDDAKGWAGGGMMATPANYHVVELVAHYPRL